MVADNHSICFPVFERIVLLLKLSCILLDGNVGEDMNKVILFSFKTKYTYVGAITV